MNGENCLAAGKCKDCVVNVSGNMVQTGFVFTKPPYIAEDLKEAGTKPWNIYTNYFPIKLRSFIDYRTKDFLNTEELRILFAKNKTNGSYQSGNS